LILSTSLFLGGADPALFDLAPTDSITAPPDEEGEIEWSSSDITMSFGWKPRVFRAQIVRELLGEPVRLSPDVTGWGLAFASEPDYGVMLVLRGEAAIPRFWSWGGFSLLRKFEVGRVAYPLFSAWLNAFARVYDESNPHPDPAP